MKDLKYLRLFDVYGALLTEHQRDICELYYMCDLSLTEIAEQKGISKQSVSDTLAKCRALLDGIVKPAAAVRYVVALGKRNLLWDLLLDVLEPNVLEVRHAE